MKELVEKVRQWGLDRNIVFTGATGEDKRAMMEAQARYTLKETAELLDAYADQDIDKINDAIGDILVTLIVGASSDEEVMKDVGFEYLLELEEDNSNTNQFQLSAITSTVLGLVKTSQPCSLEYRIAVWKLNDVLKMINREYNQKLSLKDCLELAYNEIKDRKGKVVNGQFIKD